MLLGKAGFYTGLIAPAVLIVGAVAVYYVIMCSVLYPILLAIYVWIFSTEPNYDIKPSFSRFSTSYCAIGLFPILVWLCSKKDLKIFMKVGSFGVVFVVFLMLFIVTTGIVSLENTTYMVGPPYKSDQTDWSSDNRILVMFSTQFSSLAGCLGTGYFLHTCSLPILKANRNPENNTRDLFWGYLMVFISYATVGVMGYIGFMGFDFRTYFITEQADVLRKGQT